MESEALTTQSDTTALRPLAREPHVPCPVRADRIELFALEEAAQKINLPPGKNCATAAGHLRALELGADPCNVSSHRHHSEGNQGSSADLPEPQAQPAEQRENNPVILVVDQRMTMLFGSRRRTKSVIAAQAAALIAWRAASVEQRLGCIVFNDRTIEELSPRCSRRRVRLVLHVLISLNHAVWPYAVQRSELGVLNDALRRAGRSAPAGSRIFVITDGSGWNEQTTALTKELGKANSIFVILVYDRRQIDCHNLSSSFFHHSSRKSNLGQNAHQRFEVRRGPLKWAAQIACGPLPPEVSVVMLNTHANVVSQLVRTWGNPQAMPQPQDDFPGYLSPAAYEQSIYRTSV